MLVCKTLCGVFTHRGGIHSQQASLSVVHACAGAHFARFFDICFAGVMASPPALSLFPREDRLGDSNYTPWSLRVRSALSWHNLWQWLDTPANASRPVVAGTANATAPPMLRGGIR